MVHSYVIIALFFSIILFFCLMNFSTASSFFKEHASASIEAAIHDFEMTYQDKFSFKNLFINLNGMIARLLGQSELNDVILLKNGYLATTAQNSSVDNAYSVLTSLKALDEHLDARGIPLLYVQTPYLFDGNKDLLPGHIDSNLNEIADVLTQQLATDGLDYIDLREEVKKDGLDHYEMFFKTDHHWKPEAAFWAANKTMRYFNEHFGFSLDEPLMDLRNYTIKIYEDWFLGSAGKRVGRYYAGVDDFSMIYPTRETAGMELYVPKYKTARKGSFEQAIYQMNWIEEKDYFKLSPYSGYLGGDFPINYIRNDHAVNDKTLLISKDSFGLPYASFLSQYFAETIVVDLRHYQDSTLIQLIDKTDIDAVVVINHAGDLETKALFDFGQNYDDIEPAEVLNMQSLEIQAKDKRSNYTSLFEHFKPDTEYLFTIASTNITAGEADFASLIVYDANTKKVIAEKNLLANYEKPQIWKFAIHEEDTSSLRLLLYSGLRGSTEGIGIRTGAISLSEYTIGNIAYNETLRISSTANDYNYTVFYDNIQPDTAYTLYIGRISVYEGDTEEIQLRLYDIKSKKIYSYINLKADTDEQQIWNIKAPKDTPITSLLIYSGMPGKTHNIGIELSNIRLQ